MNYEMLSEKLSNDETHIIIICDSADANDPVVLNRVKFYENRGDKVIVRTIEPRWKR